MLLAGDGTFTRETSTNLNNPMMKKSTLFLALIGLVPSALLGQWTTQNGFPRSQAGSTVVGPKIIYCGGADLSTTSDLVAIYNTSGGGWSQAPLLSVARRFANVTSAGNRCYVAGGLTSTNGVTSVVDIYDDVNQQWSTADLSQARFAMGAVCVGGKVLFAGGATSLPIPPFTTSAVVDIYDTTLGTWSTAALSLARAGVAGVVANGKAFFAGGQLGTGSVSDRVDIYDGATGQWSTATLSLPRVFIGVAAVGNKVLFAGGVGAGSVNTDWVDIYDTATDTWTTASLSEARGFSPGENVAVVCNKAYFVGGNSLNLTTGLFTDDFSEVDIYNGWTDTWTVDDLPEDRMLHSTQGVGNKLYVAGGARFGTPTWSIHEFSEVYTDASCTVGIEDLAAANSFSVLPNPAVDQITVVVTDGQQGNYFLLDAAGRAVMQGRLSGERTVLGTAQLDRGIYVLRVERRGVMSSQRVVLQ